MTNLPREILCWIFEMLDLKSLLSMMQVKKQYLQIGLEEDDLWKKFLNKNNRTKLPGFSYREILFKIPPAREKQLIFDDKLGKSYEFFLEKTKKLTSQISSDRLGIAKFKIEILKLVKEHLNYIIICLYHDNPLFAKIISSKLLKDFIELCKNSIPFILKHPNPKILNHVDYSVLQAAIKQDLDQSMAFILENPLLRKQLDVFLIKDIIKINPKYADLLKPGGLGTNITSPTGVFKAIDKPRFELTPI